MGVPVELLGKQVRCPHCKQVVLAPVTAGSAPGVVPVPPVAQPQPVVVPTPSVPAVAPEPGLHVFKTPPRKEGADSIMSAADESDDEVFGSGVGGRGPVVPPFDLGALGTPNQPPAPGVTPAPGNPFAFPPAPPVPARTAAPPAPFQAPPVPAQGRTNEPPRPFVTSPAPQPAVPTPTKPPGPKPAPLPVPIPPAPAFAAPPAPLIPTPAAPEPGPDGNNPFADFETTAAEPEAPPAAPEPVADEPAPEERPRKGKKGERNRAAESPEAEPEQPKGSRQGRASAPVGGGVSLIVVVALAGYALLATVLAVYGLFFSGGEKLEPGHPLSTVPDNFGEFEPATRKKVSQYKFPVDGELPATQRAALGGKIKVGGIEVQPLAITKRPLRILTEPVKGPQLEEFIGTALVLKLAIKNDSDFDVFPMDPAFTRKSVGDDRPITRLVVNKTTYFPGGPISWPLGDKVTKKYEGQQANDYKPLGPGQSREYVVFTEAKPELVRTVEKAKEPLQWRVQVRRDPIKFRGKELPVTAIIGVDFTAADVKDFVPTSG
jgi:hypothetical protein